MSSVIKNRRSLLVHYTEAVFASCFVVYAITCVSRSSLYGACIAVAVIAAMFLFPEFAKLPRLAVLLTMIYVVNSIELNFTMESGEIVEGVAAVSLATFFGLFLATVKGLC